ncbi:alanine/glycine:cation symporter family protein [Campylobacter sp.]|uniref:alanine/glycine:cation symporter family protein n=1 Tax=Campylobacter sp. TaxID=205 RepID=UPI0026FC8F69|nr:alanine/glycine:cation symporter family protein [Campylobacter sp.]
MDKFLDLINDKLDLINGFLYGYFLVIALILAGIYFSYITRFVQFRMFFEAFRVLMEKKDRYNKNQISPFQALMISTASRVGIGNIAGISAAIVAGGPGALFWMCLMAFLGSASAFAESTLAQVYKSKDVLGFKGGPAYYIKDGLGIKWLGSLFAAILIITYAYGFNGLQSYTMTSAFEIYYDATASSVKFSDSLLPVAIGIILMAFSIVLFFSKSHIIGKVSSYIVPFMALAYVLLSFIAIMINLDKIPQVVKMIFESAFDFKAIFGGFAGSVIVIGIKRGLFSNEAGMGSAPNAAAAAHTSHPVKQGLVQALSVFIDMTICIASGLIVLFSQAYVSKQTGSTGEVLTALPLIQAAMREYYGEIGLHFITVAVVLFAITSLIGNFYYAQANIKFLTKNSKIMFVFKISAVIMVFVGAQMNLKVAWNIADVTMAFMATINIIAILFLSKIIMKTIKDYETQRKSGVNPEFHPENLGIMGTTCWKGK